MERSSILRWAIIALVVFLAWRFGPKLWGGDVGGQSSAQPLGAESTCNSQLPCAPKDRTPEATCTLEGVRYAAEFSTRSATLKHLQLVGERYHEKDGSRTDLVTTPDFESRRPLRFDWRGIGADGKDAQVPFDAFDWKLEKQDPKECVFTYADDLVELRRVVRPTDRPFELTVSATIKNLSVEKRKHRLSVETVAWRLESEVSSHMGRQSPFVTTVDCMADTKATRMHITDFEPGDFADKGFDGSWFVKRGGIDFASVSNFYFSQALMPQSPLPAECRMQIEERWNSAQFADKSKDPSHGAMYRARLGYDLRELAQNETATYEVIAFLGPKERDVLAGTAGGAHRLNELVDLGYFSIIAKVLLQYLVWLHAKLGNWGLAIVLMTVSIRMLLFPLTWKSIQSGFQMRRLKPEIDSINEKYKDDAQGKNVATMDLWKKHKVNPLGGCLPAVFQLPIWWALYTSLQTAVELYHTPFLYFPDLSAPDPYYIIPVVLGGTMILQQRLMPMQMDPVQQKMMTFVMPAVFTVMMLFLPSGLAVYMLTNSVLGIAQQVAIEKYWSSKSPPGSSATGITVREKSKA